MTCISCYIIDDEPFAITKLTRLIATNSILQLVGTSTNPLEGLAFIRSNPVKLLFLDIDMAEMGGLELAKLVDIKIIWTTAHDEHVFQSLNIENTIDFLQKPIREDRFQLAIKRAFNNFLIGKLESVESPPQKPVESLHIKTAVGKKDIPVSKIYYIEAYGYYSIIVCVNDERVIAFSTLKEIENTLPMEIFTRIHKSYIINKKRLLKIKYSSAQLEGNITLPVGRAYRSNFDI